MRRTLTQYVWMLNWRTGGRRSNMDNVNLLQYICLWSFFTVSSRETLCLKQRDLFSKLLRSYPGGLTAFGPRILCRMIKQTKELDNYHAYMEHAMQCKLNHTCVYICAFVDIWNISLDHYAVLLNIHARLTPVQ